MENPENSESYREALLADAPKAPKAVSLGDATLKISIDAASVDEIIARLERAVAAFKAEWQRR